MVLVKVIIITSIASTYIHTIQVFISKDSCSRSSGTSEINAMVCKEALNLSSIPHYNFDQHYDDRVFKEYCLDIATYCMP